MTELEEKLWTVILRQLNFCMVGSVLRYRFLSLDLKFQKLELDLFKVSNS